MKMTKIKSMSDKIGLLPEIAPSDIFQKIVWKRRLSEAFKYGCTVQDLKLISYELEEKKL